CTPAACAATAATVAAGRPARLQKIAHLPTGTTSGTRMRDRCGPRFQRHGQRIGENSMNVNFLPVARLVLSLAAGLSLAGAAIAGAVYDAAVAQAGRSSDAIQRDVPDRPASVLRFAAIRPGMQVADFFAADGYYSELLSYVVGPKGHVLLINNPAYDKFA